jgi:hypothetical protein
MLLYDVARGWFRLTPESTTKRKTKAISAVSNGILALVFGIVPMPVIIRWIGWGLCWVGFVYILLSGVPLLYRLPRKTRVVMGFILVIFFVESLLGTEYRQWKEETAAAQDGYIHSNSIGHGQLALRIGKDGGPIPWDKESLKMFPDTSFRIERGNDGVELSTEVHDKRGNLVVSIDKNHWHITNQCLDKNYTDDSLEVKDLRGRIVLQVVLYPDTVQVQGEWHNGSGWGIRWSDSHGGTKAGHLDYWKTPDQERAVENQHLIEPMFQYPSKDHWREMAKPQQ